MNREIEDYFDIHRAVFGTNPSQPFAALSAEARAKIERYAAAMEEAEEVLPADHENGRLKGTRYY